MGRRDPLRLARPGREAMLVIAHRGASAELPENTLPAFERAIELGADFVELDVHANDAGQLIVVHDRPPSGGQYPTLEETLDLLSGRAGAMVELKMPRRYRRHNVVERTVRLLGPDDVLVSFQHAALEEARLLRPGLRTVQHVVAGPLRQARKAWAVGFADARVSKRRLVAADALGLETLVYTVNDPGRIRALDEAGVSGIFTDDPELALRVLRHS
jgi:glycerophosphoryl diester phosphodiesterase